MRRISILCVVLLLVPASTARAGTPPDPAMLSSRIDRMLETAWNDARLKPSSPADDAAFLRRVTLDLIGRIPTVAEVRAFLADARPDKRDRLIDRLVESAAHARHAAIFWRKAWMPQTETLAATSDGTDEWLTTQFQRKTSYDRIARQLLVVPKLAQPGTESQTPRSFFTVNEGKPENLAASTARAFLGVNLDCAQCHNHPFSRWTREQFWETAAFFSRPTSTKDGMPARLQIKVPNTDQIVVPRLLTNAPATWPEKLDESTGRQVLAEWVTARNNPYFARNAVNRLWAHFFGVGLVEPLDDLSGENPASVPALLAELSNAFVESDFDLAYVTRAIVRSRAYQLSSVRPEGDPTGTSGPRLFSRAAVRGLTGEQLHDSLRVAAGIPPLRPDLDPQETIRDRSRFVARFHVERPGMAERSILQSLSLMNGELTSVLTNSWKSPTLVGVIDAPFLDVAGKIDTLFLAAVGRRPTAEEATRLVRYVEQGGPEHDRRKALADVFWALLNSAEFNTNH